MEEEEEGGVKTNKSNEIPPETLVNAEFLRKIGINSKHVDQVLEKLLHAEIDDVSTLLTMTEDKLENKVKLSIGTVGVLVKFIESYKPNNKMKRLKGDTTTTFSRPSRTNKMGNWQNKRTASATQQTPLINVIEKDVVTTDVLCHPEDEKTKEKIYEKCFCNQLGCIAAKDISKLDKIYKIFISYAWDRGGFTKRHAQDLARYLKNSGFKHVIYDGDNGGEYTLPGLLKHLRTSDIIILLVTPVLNQKLMDLAHPHVIRDEVNIITQHLSNTEWKGQIIPILLQGTKESLPNTSKIWSELVYEDFTSVFENKLNTDESKDYYSLFFSLLVRILKSFPYFESILPSRNREFRTEVKEVLQLFEKTNFSTPRPVRPVLGGNLPSLENFIYARETTIGKCCKLLEESKRLIISGMAGVGKTSIGLTVIKKMNFETIWYIDTKDSEVELAEIYKRIVCDELKLEMEAKEMDIPGRIEVKLRKAAQNYNMPLLIVFENVDNEALCARIEKEFIKVEISAHVSVMILTRCDISGSATVPVVKISLLDDEDAIQLLYHYSSKESYQEPLMNETLERCKENITKLSEMEYNILKNLSLVLLARHPLALVLTGSTKRECYPNSWKTLETEWVNAIQDIDHHLYSSSDIDPKKRVVPSIHLTMKHLDEMQTKALHAISFWGSRGTSVPFAWAGKDTPDSIFSSLKRLNLVQERFLDEKRLSCHSLVAESVWISLPPTEQVKVATQCIEVALDEDANLLSIESRHQRVNCLSSLVIEKTRILDELLDDWSFSSLLKRYRNIAYDFGLYRPGIPISRLALDIDKKSFGEETPEVATDLNDLAELLRNQGKYDEAKPYYEQAIGIWKKVHGEEHLVATGLNNLAELLRSQGKFDEAKPYYEQAIAIFKKVFGDDHPNVATPLNNLAGLLKAQGKFTEAEPLYDQSLAIRRKALGEEHPDVAQSLNNLALLLTDQGKFEEAEKLQHQALAIFRNTLVEDHPNVATSLNNLARLLRKQGSVLEAKPLCEKSLEIRTRVFGGHSIDAAISSNELACIKLKLDLSNQSYAKELHDSALKILVELNGPNGLYTLRELNEWASIQ